MIIETGAIQLIKGRIKDLVIYRYNGKTYARRLPDKAKLVMSEAARLQKERMAGVAALYQAAKKAGLAPLWTRAKPEGCQSGYNYFVQNNIRGFTGEGAVSDFRKITLTAGDLQLPDDLRLAPAPGGAWALTWNNDFPYPDCAPDDRALALVMRDKESFSIAPPDIPDARRAACAMPVALPPGLEGYTHLFVYFATADGSRTSRCRYFELTQY